jgi:geranylgeranyl diphosphate synthase type II
MFDLRQYLKTQQAAIDRALEEALPAEDTRPALLHKAMRYSVFTGGKRLRPILCLAAAQAVGAPQAVAMPAAIAIELLHTYTLIHDDLPCMDDDDERRGRPTCHKVFGDANAVLTGDAMQAEAFRILSAHASTQTARLIQELSIAASSRGVVGGQVEDIAAAGKDIDAATLAFVHQHKTADLFLAAIRMGAIAAEASDAQLASLTTYANALGLAFQLVDDLLDADEIEAGSAGDGELSALRLHGKDTVAAQARAQILLAKEALETFSTSAVEALNAIADYVVERTH